MKLSSHLYGDYRDHWLERWLESDCVIAAVRLFCSLIVLVTRIFALRQMREAERSAG